MNLEINSIAPIVIAAPTSPITIKAISPVVVVAVTRQVNALAMLRVRESSVLRRRKVVLARFINLLNSLSDQRKKPLGVVLRLERFGVQG